MVLSELPISLHGVDPKPIHSIVCHHYEPTSPRASRCSPSG
ncbi:hypothetical protein [Vulcanococcus limneticus]